MLKKKVAIQGVRASFHDVAARKFFSHLPHVAVECKTFTSLCESLQSHEADYAIMAIENTIAGSILPNYALLEKYGFKILGEVYLRIEMCLLALSQQTLSDIRRVQSHPMALLQCTEFLSSLGAVQLVEASDTAESAAEIKEKNLLGSAAIASRLAAETYGLSILKENIETDSANFTRFLVLARADHDALPMTACKASYRFEAEHQHGSLVKALSILAAHEINLTKIQSIPILGKPYQYGFHVDVEWKDFEKYKKGMRSFQQQTINLIHFGDYQSGEKPFL